MQSSADLLEICETLVKIDSVSGDEGRIASFVSTFFTGIEGVEVRRIADNVVVRRACPNAPRVIVAGHLDTVPPPANPTVTRSEDVLIGLGASDMKGGLAVMLALALGSSPRFDLTYIFYACEEVESSRSGLKVVLAAMPELASATAAILMEPTDNFVEAGCQGSLNIDITIEGVRSHTARPWMGVNAIAALQPVLSAVASFTRRTPEIDGVVYREALSPVKIAGGVANNVVPDSATLVLNHRFAPDRTAEQAFKHVKDHILAEIEESIPVAMTIREFAEGAPPSLTLDLFDELSTKAAGVRAKLGWTDVACFTSLGVPATNYGPGDPLLAHTKGEWVGGAALVGAFDTLSDVLRIS